MEAPHSSSSQGSDITREGSYDIVSRYAGENSAVTQWMNQLGVDHNEVVGTVHSAWKSLPELRDWQSEFLSGFAPPFPAEFALRVQMNLRRFQHNYLYVFAAGLITAVLMNPYFLLSVAIIAVMVRYSMANSITVKGYELSSQEKMGLIGGIAVFLNYVCGTFHTLMMGSLIGLSLVAFHVFFHNPFSRTSKDDEMQKDDDGAISEV